MFFVKNPTKCLGMICQDHLFCRKTILNFLTPWKLPGVKFLWLYIFGDIFFRLIRREKFWTADEVVLDPFCRGPGQWRDQTGKTDKNTGKVSRFTDADHMR